MSNAALMSSNAVSAGLPASTAALRSTSAAPHGRNLKHGVLELATWNSLCVFVVVEVNVCCDGTLTTIHTIGISTTVADICYMVKTAPEVNSMVYESADNL